MPQIVTRVQRAFGRRKNKRGGAKGNAPPPVLCLKPTTATALPSVFFCDGNPRASQANLGAAQPRPNRWCLDEGERRRLFAALARPIMKKTHFSLCTRKMSPHFMVETVHRHVLAHRPAFVLQSNRKIWLLKPVEGRAHHHGLWALQCQIIYTGKSVIGLWLGRGGWRAAGQLR